MKQPKWYNWTGDAMWDDYCRAACLVVFLPITLFVVLLIAAAVWSAVTNPRAAAQSTSSTQVVQECPPDTEKGAYHSRGYDKDGNITCGFTYFNECPYFAGAEAGTPECEKGKPTPEQLEPWQPEETKPAPQAAQCGGK